MASKTPPDTVCNIPDRSARLSLEGLLPYIPKSAGCVLDCTADPANRGARLKQHGAREVVGLVDERTITPGPSDGYDDIVQGPLDFISLPFARGQFDCIICTAILERLRNPEAFLPALVNALAPGGLFLATVPNMQYHKIVCALAEGRWAYGDSGVWARTNLRFFTAREIKALLRNTGLTSCKLAALVQDSGTAFPRDADGYARRGRLRIGPLDDAAYQAWLVEYYVVLASGTPS